ncbi:class I SAM-dependent methyltransferase [Acidiferrimicrobium sp. IK]|uniref:RsmG family class I SAM-dependent methyltransferase n=1 Tax=Acidiferrimicrobium sp. IK TaxID=2871700 RepID=UPI0021CB92C2|nr:RsmG family class I SAM-dependent methyltransferase [Acidiferrimicrobium sp. IK]MCU4186131.1 class I SAM-dependent methyltransferase [Acidiferrimicrobium sp. IK]
MTTSDPVPGLEAGDRARLTEVLHRSRELGFLGPGPIDDQIDRSLALVPVVLRSAAAANRTGSSLEPAREGAAEARKGSAAASGRLRAMDLGSGGGVPGLVLALAIPAWEWTLLDGSAKRAGALEEFVATLALGGRVDVIAQRAEEAARGALRGAYDLLVARGFAAPAPTAECAAPFLRVGGAAVVTEPPGGAPDRWLPSGLSELGLVASESMTEPLAAQVLRQVVECPARYPRRTGIPVKRPLWS